MFEISFVDHDEPFFQLDNNPVYKLKCRLFEYGSEGIDTGVSAIDQIETDSSLDALSYQFTLEQTGTYTEEIALEDNDLLLLDRTDGGGSDAGDNINMEDAHDIDTARLITEDSFVSQIGEARQNAGEKIIIEENNSSALQLGQIGSFTFEDFIRRDKIIIENNFDINPLDFKHQLTAPLQTD